MQIDLNKEEMEFIIAALDSHVELVKSQERQGAMITGLLGSMLAKDMSEDGIRELKANDEKYKIEAEQESSLRKRSAMILQGKLAAALSMDFRFDQKVTT